MDDLISRQAAIDALDEQIEQCDKALSSFDISMRDGFAVKVERASLVAFRETLEYLPSAQPEIIRCTECKHYREYDSEYVENAVVVQCMADRYPISETIPDGWFCAGAERKDDE